MKRHILGVMVATALCLALVPASASARVVEKPKKLSTSKYAKTVCSSYKQVTSTITKLSSDLNAISSADNAGLQSQAVDLTSKFLDNVRQSQSKLKKIYPDVSNGKKINKLFVANFGELITGVSDALNKFKAADPNNPAFVADVTQFTVAFTTLSVKLSDPFSAVKDQDLLGAFDSEKSCKGVVTVF